MIKQVLLLSFLLTYSIISYSQSLEEKFDALLTNQFSETEPGATALLSINGEVVYHKAFGKANLELDVSMKPEMVFRIASISKQFTAISILMLMEQGKLSLQDSITQYIEDYPTQGQHITIQHLLTHTSGITRSISQNPWNANIRKHDFDSPSFINYFKNEPMNFAPGEAFQYNNFGYFILGHIIEKITGMTYADFVTKNIFQPLEMRNSSEANNSDLVKNRAYGYEKYKEFVNREYVSPTQALGAGSLMSTVEDLYKWNEALNNYKLVSKKSLELAFTNHTLKNGKNTNYGFGWFINEINGSPTVEHSGGEHGFRTHAIYLPKEDVFVAIFANCSCSDPGKTAIKMAAMAINKPYQKPAPISLDKEDLYKWVGKYTFSDGSYRNVMYKNKKLLWVLPAGIELEMWPKSKNSFMLENGLTEINFELLATDTIQATYKSRINVKTSKKPYTKRTKISLAKNVKKKYIGRYKVTPTYDIIISLDGEQLKATGTGQEPLNLYPESSTRFFFKAIDSYIDFILDNNGHCTGLEITQNNATYPSNKVE